VTTARRQLDLAMTEAQWQRTITDLAETLGWLVYHTYDSRRSEPGFPDLVLVRAGDRVVFAEIKRETGRLTDDQAQWWWALERAGAEIYVWRPSDWPQVEQTLTRRGGP
jgi:hypothetical protein